MERERRADRGRSLCTERRFRIPTEYDPHMVQRLRTGPKLGRLRGGLLRHVGPSRSDDPRRRGQRHRARAERDFVEIPGPTGQHRAGDPGDRHGRPARRRTCPRQARTALKPARRPGALVGWPGGIFSILLILAQLYASPAAGAASFLGIIVTVGVATSILVDHDGRVGVPVHPASLSRILGAIVMLAGWRSSPCPELGDGQVGGDPSARRALRWNASGLRPWWSLCRQASEVIGENGAARED